MSNSPKVFISYSWAGEEYKTQVLHLAESLVSNHVDVIFDQWDLRPGHDMYAFMERSIAEADKVLILCDKTYADKANNREGGVGTETTIITPEVYRKSDQVKFIPVIMEGFDIIPTYLNGRMGIDLREGHRQEGFQELLRTVYDKPLVEKPELGQEPEWRDERHASIINSSMLVNLENKEEQRRSPRSSLSNNVQKEKTPEDIAKHRVQIKKRMEDILIDRSKIKTHQDRLRLARNPNLKFRPHNIILLDPTTNIPDYNNGMVKTEPYDFTDQGILVHIMSGILRQKIKLKDGTLVDADVLQEINYKDIYEIEERGGPNIPYPTLLCRFEDNKLCSRTVYVDPDTGMQYDQSDNRIEIMK